MQQQTYEIPKWNQMMAGWNALINPTRCPVCGAPRPQAQSSAATGTDWLSQWNEMPVVKDWNRVWGGMFDSWMQSMKPVEGQPQQHQQHTQQHHHEHHHEHHQAKHKHGGCGCSCCQPDDCHCRCCVVNADLLVYARLGESRVVPVTIENNIRREREVEVELSDWTTNSKQAVKVEGKVEPETKFTLKPCEERTLLILARVSPDTKSPDTNSADKSEGSKANAAQSKESSVGNDVNVDLRQGQLPDVDECTVFYADLRVKGCDIRPIRIALVVMPRDCDTYKIDCQCGCCC
jgi:hypothetical protein